MTTPKTEPVDRTRRAQFVQRLVGVCIGLSAATTAMMMLGYGGVSDTLPAQFVGACMGLATAATLAYIGGSVVDYNGGVMNTFTRKEPRYEPSNSATNFTSNDPHEAKG